MSHTLNFVGEDSAGGGGMVVLRMNREFMEFKRVKHNNLSLQQFGKTIVELMDTKNDASAWLWWALGGMSLAFGTC